MPVVHLLLNPADTSKRRFEATAAIRRKVQLEGKEVVEVRPASPEEVAPNLTEARHHGVTRLLIAGGDGLLHLALPAIVGSDLPIGIIPIGTGNDFARALGLPSRLDAAIDAALLQATAVDLISTNTGQWAASVVTGGFSGRVTARANGLRFPTGSQRYTVATLIELAKLQATDLELHIDDEVHQFNCSLFAIANTRFFGGGMAISPNAVPSDGLLDVTVVGATSRRELARVLPTVFLGRHIDHPSVSIFRGRRIHVRTTADLWADGEPLITGGDDTVASFTAISRALRVAGTLVGT